MNEKRDIQIVDDNDEVIGHKKRADVDYIRDIYRNTALWVTNSKGQVLIAQRKFTKDKDPGRWGPAVAGTVEEGESYESNVYKEAEEELGITNIQFNIRDKQRRRTPRNYFTQWYSVILDWLPSQFKIQEEEVEQITWINKSELARDVKENPDKYIPSMQTIVTLFVRF
ncbi:MAG: NUDIX domain-containing protein [Patescibacteria group bacterium]